LPIGLAKRKLLMSLACAHRRGANQPSISVCDPSHPGGLIRMTEFLVLAALCGVVWLAAAVLRGGLLATCLLLLVAGTCFGPFFFSLEVKPIPLTSDRALCLLLLAQFAVWWRWGLTRPQPLGRADVALAAFLMCLLVNTFVNDWKFTNNQPVSKLLFYYLMPAVIYWVARYVPFDERRTRVLFGVLAVLGLYLAATSVAEAFGFENLVFPRYINSPEHVDFRGRGRGPLLNPAADGLLMAIGLSATWLWWPRLTRPGQLLLLLAQGVYLAGVGCTFTRCAWIGAAASSLIVIGLTIPRHWRVPLVAGCLLVTTAVAATQWERLLAFKRDEGQSAQEAAESVKLRPILAMIAWKMFQQRPVFGCGFGNYRKAYVSVLNDRDTDLPLEKGRPYVQHNVFLALLAETGLVGMCLFTLLLTLWTRDAWRLYHSNAPPWARQHGLLFLAMLGSYLANAMFHDLAIIPMVNMFVFFLAGTVAGLRQIAPAQTPSLAQA
jgi:O-antigen ligase